MRFIRILALLLATLSLAAPSLPQAADGLEKVTVAQFGKERFLLYLPLYVAMEEGLFKKHGLDIDLKFVGNDDQVFAAVMSGQAEFGVGDPVFTAISHDKGGPGKTVALMITRLGLSGVAKNPDLKPIKSPHDLNGLRISSFPEPSTTYTLLNQIRHEQNIDLKIVEAPFGGQIALLEAGQVDIAVDIEPSISIAEDKGYRIVFDLSPFTDPQAITGITVMEDTIKKHPETVQKFVDALQEAVDLIYSHPDVAYSTGRKIYPGLSEKVVQAAVGRMLRAHIYPSFVVVTDDLWQRTLRTRLNSGELKNPQSTDVAVDNSFALKAQKDVGSEK